jgi:hypothetical protein
MKGLKVKKKITFGATKFFHHVLHAIFVVTMFALC